MHEHTGRHTGPQSEGDPWLPAALLPVRIRDPLQPAADMLLYHGHHFAHALPDAPSPSMPHWLLLIGAGEGRWADWARAARLPRGAPLHGPLDAFWLLPHSAAARLEASPTGVTIVLFPNAHRFRRPHGSALCAGRAEDELTAYSSADDPLRRELAGAARAAVAQPDKLPGGYLAELANALAAHLLSAAGGGAPESRGRRPDAEQTVRRLTEHIDAHLAGDLSLAALAALAGWSAHHLAHTFTEIAGRPLHQYVLARRLDEAMRLLRQGGRSVAEVGRAVGFADQSHLARQFKRRFGVSPLGARQHRKI